MTTRSFRLLAASLLALPLVSGVAGQVKADGCRVDVVLKPYTTNAAVTCLESRLAELGYTVGTPNTYYDPVTAKAVKAFQTTRGLYNDGIVTSIVARQLGLRGSLPSGPGVSKVTVIGDSTSAAMRWYDEANNVTTAFDVMGSHHDLVWSIESCRRLVSASCRGRVDPGTGLQWAPVSVLPLMQGTLRGRLGQALVIMAGYDDVSITNAIDQIVSEARLQGVSRVFWLNYRIGPGTYSYKKYYEQHNRDLESAKARQPNLQVLDWNGFANSQPPETQASWFASDGIHLTRVGAAALAAFIDAAVDNSDVDSCLAANASTGFADPTSGDAADPTVAPSGFSGVTPVRVLDTRTGTTGRVGAGRTVTIDLDGVLPAGNGHATVGYWRDLQPQMRHLDELGAFQMLEVRSSLPDELLMFGDKLSMAHSIEVRVPYLDRTIVEFAQRLGAGFMIRGRERKWLHRQVCRGYLPPQILARKKRGFAVNVVDGWFNSSVNGRLTEMLLDPQSLMYRHLNPAATRGLFEAHRSGRADNHKLLFSLVMVEFGWGLAMGVLVLITVAAMMRLVDIRKEL